MFERFTDRARRVIVLAQAIAPENDDNFIGVEHLLLGMLREEEGIAGRVLISLGFKFDEVLALVGRGVTPSPTGHIPFTPRSKKVLELALREALGLGHNYIGTEHLLLGITRDTDGKAAEILGDLAAVRRKVLDTLPEENKTRPRSLHVVGIQEPDDQWRKIKAVWDACVAARIDPPQVVNDFFGGRTPDERNGVAIDLKALTIDWTLDSSSGVEIELAALPEKVTKIRVFLQ